MTQVEADLAVTNVNVTSWTPERSSYVTFTYSNVGSEIAATDLDVWFV